MTSAQSKSRASAAMAILWVLGVCVCGNVCVVAQQQQQQQQQLLLSLYILSTELRSTRVCGGSVDCRSDKKALLGNL